MVELFALSAISEIVDVIDTGIPDHAIYVYQMEEKASRPQDIWRLFEYILQNDYNSAWDKNLWADIEGYCYVRDLADWFVSGECRHKLGTIYALLNSISKSDKYLFGEIVYELTGANIYDVPYIPYLAYLIVKRYVPDSLEDLETELERKKVATDRVSLPLMHRLLTLIYDGKSCCHLEKEEEWEWVREQRKQEIPGRLQMFQEELKLKERLGY